MKPYLEKTSQLTPSNAQTALVDLELSAVALCNEGSNSRADIILMKGKESDKMPNTFEELVKALNPEHAEILTKHIGEVESAKDAVIKDLQGQVTTLTAKVEELTKAKSAETKQDDVLKGVSPEVQALFAKQQATIDGLLATQADELAKARFEKCKAIPCAEDELKAVLKAASPAVVAVLEKAAAAIEASTLTAKGKETSPDFAGSTAADIYGKLEKSAQAIMSANEGMTFEQAFTKACSDDPDTYQKYVEGVK